MKQVIQDVRTGRIRVEEVPEPNLKAEGLLVRNMASVVSSGTERMLLEFAEKSWLGKARERPDLVKQVWGKVKRDGWEAAYNAVQGRLQAPLCLGYSSAGAVIDVGANARDEFAVGDRVACAGMGYAAHAEVVHVPKNLCAKVPAPALQDAAAVRWEHAAFSTLGAIALQGVRLASPTLGESVAVMGLGLIGQLSLQLLLANGCRVFGLDLAPDRLELARRMGCHEIGSPGDPDIAARILGFTKGRGADAVLIAAATGSNQPVELAGEISRKKGRVVIVGAVKMDIPRRSYYEKELTVSVSSSYGPGRYDAAYEEKGLDYPVAHVRWTAKRNMEAFLDLLAQGKLDLQALITHRFPIAQAQAAYELLDGTRKEPSLGIVLAYPDEKEAHSRETVLSLGPRSSSKSGAAACVGVIGAGQFARSVLLPKLAAAPGVRLRTLVAATGVSAKAAGERFGFERCSTDYAQALEDPEINAVFILTRHSLHARLASEALKRGKHVFVEKPLCVTPEELRDLASLHASLAQAGPVPILFVGFNRRFSPLSRRIKEFFGPNRGPLMINYRINAGSVPPDHWTQDPLEGGRIVGECCHFVDLAVHLTDALPAWVGARAIGADGSGARDTFAATIGLSDGSVLSLSYAANGDAALGKERLEVFSGGRSAVLEDFRRLTLLRDGRPETVRPWRQQKGHAEELDAFLAAVRGGGPPPIPLAQLCSVTQATFLIEESLKEGKALSLDPA